jgi:hypothetical protein
VRNKARLVAKGFSQVEGLDFGETFASVARLEAICILLTYASCYDIKFYRMDVKSAFLNGFINKLVYVEQPPRFEDPRYPNHAYRLSKTLLSHPGFRGPKLGREIITRCAGTKSHTYDE